MSPRRGPRLLTSVAMIVLVTGVGAAVALALSGWPTAGNEAPVARPGASAGPASPGPASPGPASPGPASPAATSPVGPVGLRAERIKVERLGIDLPIVEGDGIDAPLDRAAHYPGSGWPDGGTNIYLYGHARAGIFLPLWEAQVGDRIVLALSDGTSRDYEVARVVPDAPWNAVSYLDPTPREQLTLQTSTSNGATDPRFIVIAYPAS